MDIESVRIFADVIKQGSFAAVARQRNIDPSSVSRSIGTLEAELGFRLFQRTTRKLAPTEAGAEYFDRVQGLIGEFDRASEAALDLVSLPIGTLRITACTSFGQRILAPLLSKLRSQYPDLTIDMHLVDHHVDIVEEKIDIAIRFGKKPEGDFIVSQLVPRQFHVCASPAWISENGHLATPNELEKMDCMLFSIPGIRKVWRFRKRGDQPFEVPVSGHVLTSHGVTMTKCAVAGLGPALLPDWLCRDEIQAGDLVSLFPDYECTATEFDTAAWLVYPSRSYVPKKVRVFIDFLRDEVRGFA
ncbi:MAG: LysR family transcriptional regulator [Woeseia sp.]